MIRSSRRPRSTVGRGAGRHPPRPTRASPRAAPGDVWQEPQGVERTRRHSQPPCDRPTIGGERRPQQRPMRGDPTVVRTAVGKHDPLSDNDRHPFAFLRDDPREPPAPIGHREQTRNIDELGLDLDEQQGPRGGVPRDKVDDTPLTKVAERCLRPNLPAGRDKHRRQPLAHDGVAPRDDSLDLAAAPARLQAEPNLEDARDSSNGRNSQLIEMAALSVRIDGARDPGTTGTVELPPAEPKPKAAEEAPEAEIVHEPRVWPRTLIRRSPEAAAYPPAAPRSTNLPKPRVPTKAPSRMTGRPRTKTERTAPVTEKPSYGV